MKSDYWEKQKRLREQEEKRTARQEHMKSLFAAHDREKITEGDLKYWREVTGMSKTEQGYWMGLAIMDNLIGSKGKDLVKTEFMEETAKCKS